MFVQQIWVSACMTVFRVQASRSSSCNYRVASNSPELESICWAYCQIVQCHRQKCRPSCYLSCRYPVDMLWHTDILNSERLCNRFPDSIIQQDINNQQVQQTYKPINHKTNPSIYSLFATSFWSKKNSNVQLALNFVLISSWYWSSLPFAWLIIYRNYSSPQCKSFSEKIKQNILQHWLLTWMIPDDPCD